MGQAKGCCRSAGGLGLYARKGLAQGGPKEEVTPRPSFPRCPNSGSGEPVLPCRMFFTSTLATTLVSCLAAAIVLPGAQDPAPPEPKKPTLSLSVTRGDYHEGEGSMKLTLVATNSTPKDVVITGAKLVNISLNTQGKPVLLYTNPLGLPPFQRLVVGAAKSEMFEVFSNLALAAFYRDGLEPTGLPEDQRINARAGRLILEVQSVDGSGRKHESFFRVGTVTVTRENGAFVRPLVVTDDRSFDAFEADTMIRLTEDLVNKR